MARLKTFLKYIIWVILFFIFSQVLIFISLNIKDSNNNETNNKQITTNTIVEHIKNL